MDVVAVDIGGTHCRFAVAAVGDGPPRLGPVTTLRTADHASFRAAWAAFAAGHGVLPATAGIAVAGPVGAGAVQLTNNSWVIDPARIADELGRDAVQLVNDFVAVAQAVDALGPADFVAVAGPPVGLPAQGVISVVGPGTGLGVAQLLRGGGPGRVVASEGGHGDFAPLDAVDDALLVRLRQAFGRVSVERVVAGPGLVHIHAALCARDGVAVPPRDAAALWTAALAGADPLAAAALDRFCLNLGAVSGDLALAHGADAVVIAGGVGLRLAGHLPRSGFARRFVAKGRLAAHMARLPVLALIHPQPGLVGAALAAARPRQAGELTARLCAARAIGMET